MKIPLLTLLPAMALASCQTVADDAPAEFTAPGYHAVGTEPFWSLTIDGTTMIFSRPGEDDLFASDTTVRPSFNGWRHVAKTMTADITFSPCSDGMSDRTYKDSVTVVIGDKSYKGCGGGILAPNSMEQTHWRISFINGAAIPADRNASINFADGRANATVGCNRLSAPYQYAAKTLSFGPVMATRMACPDAIAPQEQAFVAILNTLKSAEFQGDGSWLLTGKDGGAAILEQSL